MPSVTSDNSSSKAPELGQPSKMDVTSLFKEMQDTLSEINNTIKGLKSNEQEAKLEELEVKRQNLLADLNSDFEKRIADVKEKYESKQKQTEERRRKEDEEREARRKKEDDELRKRRREEDDSTKRELESKSDDVEKETDSQMDEVEEEARKFFEEGRKKLKDLEVKRQDINHRIEEQLQAPSTIPDVPRRKRNNSKKTNKSMKDDISNINETNGSASKDGHSNTAPKDKGPSNLQTETHDGAKSESSKMELVQDTTPKTSGISAEESHGPNGTKKDKSQPKANNTSMTSTNEIPKGVESGKPLAKESRKTSSLDQEQSKKSKDVNVDQKPSNDKAEKSAEQSSAPGKNDLANDADKNNKNNKPESADSDIKQVNAKSKSVDSKAEQSKSDAKSATDNAEENKAFADETTTLPAEEIGTLDQIKTESAQKEPKQDEKSREEVDTSKVQAEAPKNGRNSGDEVDSGKTQKEHSKEDADVPNMGKIAQDASKHSEKHVESQGPTADSKAKPAGPTEKKGETATSAPSNLEDNKSDSKQLPEAQKGNSPEKADSHKNEDENKLDIKNTQSSKKSESSKTSDAKKKDTPSQDSKKPETPKKQDVKNSESSKPKTSTPRSSRTPVDEYTDFTDSEAEYTLKASKHQSKGDSEVPRSAGQHSSSGKKSSGESKHRAEEESPHKHRTPVSENNNADFQMMTSRRRYSNSPRKHPEPLTLSRYYSVVSDVDEGEDISQFSSQFSHPTMSLPDTARTSMSHPRSPSSPTRRILTTLPDYEQRLRPQETEMNTTRQDVAAQKSDAEDDDKKTMYRNSEVSGAASSPSTEDVRNALLAIERNAPSSNQQTKRAHSNDDPSEQQVWDALQAIERSAPSAKQDSEDAETNDNISAEQVRGALQTIDQVLPSAKDQASSPKADEDLSTQDVRDALLAIESSATSMKQQHDEPSDVDSEPSTKGQTKPPGPGDADVLSTEQVRDALLAIEETAPSANNDAETEKNKVRDALQAINSALPSTKQEEVLSPAVGSSSSEAQHSAADGDMSEMQVRDALIAIDSAFNSKKHDNASNPIAQSRNQGTKLSKADDNVSETQVRNKATERSEDEEGTSPDKVHKALRAVEGALPSKKQGDGTEQGKVRDALHAIDQALPSTKRDGPSSPAADQNGDKVDLESSTRQTPSELRNPGQGHEQGHLRGEHTTTADPDPSYILGGNPTNNKNNSQSREEGVDYLSASPTPRVIEAAHVPRTLLGRGRQGPFSPLPVDNETVLGEEDLFSASPAW